MKRPPPGAALAALVLMAGMVVVSAAGAFAQTPGDPGTGGFSLDSPEASTKDLLKELSAAALRLPLAAALGATLALRPRRHGTPIRHPAVVETQIILAIVGAIIMLVVGSNLARAFGIVGVASLIRYRSKINDPKDAVVMLSALSVGLAAGTGLYILAAVSTLFLAMALWIIEGFETQRRIFELSIKIGDKTSTFRPRIEAILRRFDAVAELRGFSEQEVTYVVRAPLAMQTTRVSDYLTALSPGSEVAVEWKENPKAELAQRAGP